MRCGPAYPLLVLALVVATAVCACSTDSAPPVATPSLAFSDVAAAGSPIEITYRFAVADDAPEFTENYWVFVHFLDTDGELMWTDDHEPPTPTRQWKPGAIVEYPRVMFVPMFPYVGQTSVEVGLVSTTTGDRLPLTGETTGQRSYRIGTFDMRPRGDDLDVAFVDGWHEAESADEVAAPRWRWSKKDAILSFPNHDREIRVYLQVDQPAAALSGPQRVEVRVGAELVDSFVPTPQMAFRRFQVSASQLGSAETVDLTISVDDTFVPAALPALNSPDARELGIRVFRVFVEPL